MTSKTALRLEISERLQGLNDNFLDCRDPGSRHPWLKDVDFHVIPQQTEGKKILFLGRDFSCARCGTIKRETFQVGRWGPEKIRTYYIYPEGYQLPGVARGVKPSSVIYQEQYRRAMERAAHEAQRTVSV